MNRGCGIWHLLTNRAVLEALNDAGHPVHVGHLATACLGLELPPELMRAAVISADRVAEATRKVLA
jgi:hypothetical protein